MMSSSAGSLMLAAGVLLWSFAHFLPTRFVGFRSKLIARVGENPYKGLFSVAIVASVVLMVFGWKAATPRPIYQLGNWTLTATAVLVLAAFVFFLAARIPSNLRRLVRNPQLTGVALWAIAHLLSNGDSRSLILFGGLLGWSGLQIVFSNRRDGAWEKPPSLARKSDAVLFIVAVVACVLVAWAHQWLFNVRPY